MYSTFVVPSTFIVLLGPRLLVNFEMPNGSISISNLWFRVLAIRGGLLTIYAPFLLYKPQCSQRHALGFALAFHHSCLYLLPKERGVHVVRAS